MLFLRVFLWLVAQRGGFLEKLSATPMDIPMASCIPIASGPGRRFPEKSLAFPMGIPMASGPRRGVRKNYQLVLWVLLWLVAQAKILFLKS